MEYDKWSIDCRNSKGESTGEFSYPVEVLNILESFQMKISLSNINQNQLVIEV